MHPLTFTIFLGILQVCIGDGYFELQILSLKNSRGELADGTCCDGTRDASGTCKDSCETKFEICLKEYQTLVRESSACTFGNISTSVLGGNSFEYPPESSQTRQRLPFNFAWTVRVVDCRVARIYRVLTYLWDVEVFFVL